MARHKGYDVWHIKHRAATGAGFQSSLVARELELPILYIGTGETMNDLVKFDPHDFVDTIVDEIYA